MNKSDFAKILQAHYSAGPVTPEQKAKLKSQAAASGISGIEFDNLVATIPGASEPTYKTSSSGFSTSPSASSSSGFTTPEPRGSSASSSGFTSSPPTTPARSKTPGSDSSGFVTDSQHQGGSATRPVLDQNFHTIFANVEMMEDQGAMSVAMRGKYKGRKVFIKRIKPEYKDDEHAKELFFKEYENGIRLDHPNIVRMLDRDEDADGPFYWMELIDGQPLSKKIRGGQLNETLVKKIAVEILEALEYLHKQQIYHRDLKPDNVLITNKGDNVKIIDLGLAAADVFDDIQGVSFIGTRRYAAPEQHGDPSKVDGRADLYAFGLIVLEMLTGDIEPREHQIDKVKIPFLRDIIKECVRKNPDQRFRTATEVLDKLRANISGIGTTPQVSGSALSRKPVALRYEELLAFVKPQGVLEPSPLQKVQEVKAELKRVLDYERLWGDEMAASSMSDDDLARMIRADTYAKTKQRIEEFKRVEERKLEREKAVVTDRENNLNAVNSEMRRNDPGGPPSKLFLNTKDPAAVSRYNAKVDQYNHQLEVFRRIQTKALDAQNRYEEAVHKYDDKVREYQEALQEKNDELKPALENDIVNVVFKLGELSTSLLAVQNDPYDAFLVIFFALRVGNVLKEKLDDPRKQAEFKSTLRKFSSNLDEIVFDPQNNIPLQLAGALTYLEEWRNINIGIEDSIAARMKELPYGICEDASGPVATCLSFKIDSQFTFDDVIDPAELDNIEIRMRQRKAECEDVKKKVDDLSADLGPTFGKISDIRSQCDGELALMVQNYDTHVREVLPELAIILRVLNEEDISAHLQKFTVYFSELRANIETMFSKQISEALSEIRTTELRSIPVKEVIQGDAGFNFWPHKDALSKKNAALQKAVAHIDEQLAAIAKQPEKKAKEFRSQFAWQFIVSFVPGVSVVFAVLIHLNMTRFLPALGSVNAFYVDVRRELLRKLHPAWIIHLALGVVYAVTTYLLSIPALYAVATSSIVAGLLGSLDERKLKTLDLSAKQLPSSGPR